MPASKPRLRRRGSGRRRCSSRAIRRRSVRCRATPRSAEARRVNSCARSTRSAARWPRSPTRVSLHARFLNESKGPAVRALRQQMDKPAYARAALALLSAQPNLTIVARPRRRSHRRGGRGARVLLRRTAPATSHNAWSLRPERFSAERPFAATSVRAEGRFGEAPAIGLAAGARAAGLPDSAA